MTSFGYTNRLTMFLSDLEQDGLSQLNGECLVLLVFLIVDNLHLDNLPVTDTDI